MASTAGKIKERRLDRMRLGQAACDFVALPSDPEIRVAIVPLTEAEYSQVLSKVASIPLADDMAGAAVKDRVQACEILVRAIREEDDLTQRIYADSRDSQAIEALSEDLEVVDIDEIIDRYNEMVEKSSPRIDMIPEEELEAVKKNLQSMDWNALSGRSWYALKRFLSTIIPEPLMVNSLGSSQTPPSTTTND